MKLDPVKIMECKVCGVEIKVNANYPITEVTCQDCHRKKKMIQSCRAVWCSVSSDYLLPNEVLDTDVLREIEEQEQWEDLERSIPSCSERNRAF